MARVTKRLYVICSIPLALYAAVLATNMKTLAESAGPVRGKEGLGCRTNKAQTGTVFGYSGSEGPVIEPSSQNPHANANSLYPKAERRRMYA